MPQVHNPSPKTCSSNVSLTRGVTGSERHLRAELCVLMQEFSEKKGLTEVNRYSHQSLSVVVSLIRIRTSSPFRAAFTFLQNSENLIGKVSRKLSDRARARARVISKSCRNCQEGFSSAFWLIITPERIKSWTLCLIVNSDCLFSPHFKLNYIQREREKYRFLF